MTESWLPVVGCPSHEVSDDGQVRGPEGLLKPWLGAKKYPTVTLPIGRRYVHQLMLEAFVGSRPAGMVALHDNDIGDDNRIANLSWGTRSKNGKDAARNGRNPNAMRTHCRNKHRLIGHNLIIDKRGHRTCRECRRVSSLKYVHNKKAG